MTKKLGKKKMKAGGQAWGKWVHDHEKSIVLMGSPLGKTKRASKRGIEDIRNLMTAFTIVQAETHEAAAEMFAEHPHFMLFPGESVEIMECLPIPQV